MINGVRVYTAAVPMAAAFDHATRSRRRSESLLVEVGLADGVRGWGEGAPRGYVTGETLRGAAAAVRACDPAGLAERIDWRTFESAAASIAALPLPDLVAGPSAAAAVEIALLDAACRRFCRPLAEALAVLDAPARVRRGGPVSVSLVIHLSRDVAAVLDALPPPAVAALRHVKVKVADPADAVRRLARARSRLPAGVRVSLDVNGAWSAAQAERVAGELDGVAWVEEPLAPRSWPELARLRRATGLPVMLDESCTGPADLDTAAACGAASHVNVRLSKCGGFFAAARLGLRADALGVGCQLGVHVAEVGPLWAAGRALATAWGLWQTVEAGRADEWFPTPLTRPAFAVDRALHQVRPLTGPGTGVEPADELLRHTRCLAEWRPGDGWRRSG
ncbi:enolase C-terminal domain-like protein [Streptomyces sp. B1866]|uniref:enolase C-terminal domain-like protein n=1 Tax=Streptomyces sp. B1866 TaxID=3075431 RepID=UPI00288F8906|nr:enolase C-terminal domain-like protein [Streptomyces sp. B1866]MDT3396930.1 enolase C-terminal domain-like protein [Streptomyces sp. B1866]